MTSGEYSASAAATGGHAGDQGSTQEPPIPPTERVLGTGGPAADQGSTQEPSIPPQERVPGIGTPAGDQDSTQEPSIPPTKRVPGTGSPAGDQDSTQEPSKPPTERTECGQKIQGTIDSQSSSSSSTITTTDNTSSVSNAHLRQSTPAKSQGKPAESPESSTEHWPLTEMYISRRFGYDYFLELCDPFDKP